MRWAAQQAPAGRYLELSGGHAPFLSHAQDVVIAVRALDSERAHAA
jgi:hypothetical protein